MAASRTPSAIGMRDLALSARHDRCPAAVSLSRNGSRPSLVLPSRPTVVGAVSIELSTASSAASTTASNSASSPRPLTRGPARSRAVPVGPAGGGRGQEDLAAAVVRRRAGAGQAEPDPPGQPGAAGASRPGRRSPPRRCTSRPAGPATSAGAGSSRPTGTPSTVSRLRSPKLVSSSTATVYAVRGHPGRGADAALEAQAGHARAGADGALRRRLRRCRARPAPRRGRPARRSASTCIRRQSLRNESSHSPTTGITTSSATAACCSSAISQAAS